MSGIPDPNEWRIILNREYRSLMPPVDAEELYAKMAGIERCSVCGRLWAFWSGYQQEPTCYAPECLRDEEESIWVKPDIRVDEEGWMCGCNGSASRGNLAAVDAYRMISAVEYDSVVDVVDLDSLLSMMKLVLRCSHCGRLWAFWNDSNEDPVPYLIELA